MSFAYRISAWNRERKWTPFMERHAPTQDTLVLDVGFTAKEYSSTDNLIEKRYPYPERLTALGIDSAEQLRRLYPDVAVVTYDGTRFPFADRQFDICWSNAVLEHVGDWDRQVAFLSEVRRVSHKAFLTTPNRLFPIEVHTRTPLLHWLPKTLFDRYLKLTGKTWASGDYMHLLSASDLRRLLAQAGIENYQLLGNKILGLTIDYVVLADFG